MKVKKLFGIALLAGSLLLSSCDDILANFGGGNKKKSSEDENSENGNNYEGSGYTGKTGATELSKSEWELAFSLEETALRRNVRISCTQPYYSMVSELDNGKLALYEIYQGQTSDPVFVKFNSVTNGQVSYDGYYKEGGTWQSVKQTDDLKYIMAEMGILEYKYEDFTYSASTKTYNAPSFNYSFNAGNETIAIKVSEAIITVKDGLPAKVELDYISDDYSETERIHVTAEYSDYGKVKVDLPEGNNNNQNQNNDIPVPEGEEITFAEFKKAYEARKEASFNHVKIAVSEEGTIGNETMEATLIYGMWEGDDISDEVVRGFILDDEMLTEMREQTATLNVKYYHDSKANTYAFSYSYSADMMGESFSMSANVIYNQYFYAIQEDVAMSNFVESILMEWSTINIPATTIMHVEGRSFVGSDIVEKDYVYYNASKEVAQATSIRFDDEYCELITEKASTGNNVAQRYQVMVGPYSQDGSKVTVMFTHYAQEDGVYYEIPNGGSQITFEISQDKLTMATQNVDASGAMIEIHLLFAFDKPNTTMISYPEGDINGDEDSMTGTYIFSGFDYDVDPDGDMEKAIAKYNEYSRNPEASEYSSYILMINEDTGAFGITVNAEPIVAYFGSFVMNDCELVATLNQVMNQGDKEPSAMDRAFQFTAEYDEIVETLAVDVFVSEEDGYAIRAIYTKYSSEL